MNLEQNILSNSLKSYLIIAGVLLFTLLIKRLVSRFFASLIYTWVDKKNHSELRKIHVHRLIIPIEKFLVFVVAIIAFYELKFPETLNFHIYKLTAQQIIESLVKLLFIIFLLLSLHLKLTQKPHLWLMPRYVPHEHSAGHHG